MGKDKFLTVGVILIALVAIGLFIFIPDKNDNKVNTTEVEHLVLDKNEITLKVGDTYNLISVVSPSTAVDKTVMYTSENHNVATVDDSGKITAVAVGETNIRAYTSNGKEDNCIIKVIKKSVPIKKITLNKSDVILTEGESFSLKVTASPSNTTEHKFTWTSSNPDVATVSSSGKVTAKKAGSTTITVKSESNKVAVCDIEVKKKQDTAKPATEKSNATIKLDVKEKSLTAGDTATLKATITPSNSSEKVTWSSSNEKVAKVSSSGKITAVTAGTATITAKLANGASATCKLTVKASNGLEIHFFASGYYDDAILIRTDKATIFMDGGRGQEMVIKYLDELKIKTIDYVIGSHTEYDHIDAQGEVIRRYNVKNALYPNSITNCKCSCEAMDVRNVNAALKAKNMTAKVQSVPSKLVIGDMTLYFIAPFTIGCNKNNNSFIFILKYGNTKFMFTGDADSAFNSKDQLIANAKSLGLSGIDATVLKYPHHGNHVLSENMLSTIGAKIVVVPNYLAPKLPTSQMMERMQGLGIKVYRQSDSATGNILLKSNGTKVTVKMGVKAKDYAR